MRFTKEQRRKITTNLWNYFKPIHEHLGFEKSSTIFEISDYLEKKCKFNFNQWQRILFQKDTAIRIFNLLMNDKSKSYSKGLVCENIKRDDGQVGGSIGHYYIVKTIEEANRIKNINEARVKARIIKGDQRVIENKSFLAQLEYKDKTRKLK